MHVQKRTRGHKWVIQETPIGNKLFEHQLNTDQGKNEITIGKGHTGNSPTTCGSLLPYATY